MRAGTWVMVVAALAVASMSAVEGRQTGLPPQAIAEIESIVSKAMADGEIPGVSVAVGIGKSVVYSRGFGFADLEHDARVTPTTAFRTASTAKPMTATGVMQLVEQGKIDLDAPI